MKRMMIVLAIVLSMYGDVGATDDSPVKPPFTPPVGYPCYLHPCVYQVKPTSATRHGDTSSAERPDTDDQGMVNDPRLNSDANACYSDGVVCTTEHDWEDGWYEIRKEYGLI